MQCPKCNTENREGAKFCLKCGASLALVCAKCGRGLPSGALFCDACGWQVTAPPPEAVEEPGAPGLDKALQRLVPREFAERLLATRGQVSKERRTVTILFSDVKGSTAMAETLDPEDVMEIMNALWERLDKAITDHGGRIDKHMGDSVMALWGAETAREDDPERAIRAALAMQKEVGDWNLEVGETSNLQIRIGINTGPVLLGEVGTTGEYTAVGDTVNTASRLEQAAPVGGILISYDTYRHVRGVFTVRLLEPIRVKGKAEPLQVYLVERAKPRAFRMGWRGVEGVETRMIGREGELKLLQDALYTAMEDGERQMVTISGEAGVGKSRLLYEFENWMELLPQDVYYFKGRASQEMHNVPYALIRDLFAFRFQIQDSDWAQVVREKMEGGIGEALGENEQGQMRAHFIGQLLGFDFGDSPHLHGVLDDAQQLRDRALMYLSDYFKAMAARLPTVILLEDVHWADDSSLDVLNHLALTTPNQRLLIVCLARPALFERRPHWGEGQAFHTPLDLRPLSKRDSRRLVEEILQRVEQVPVALRELVVSGAEGNPFYVEELIKMLIEDGVILTEAERWRVEPVRLTTVRVPATLTGVLQARLDSLPQGERTTVQQASVVGRTFWDSAVVRISQAADEEVGEEVPTALSALRGKEMIFRRETSAFAGTREYIFKHAILREVTYESVLKRLRRAYHGLVADWLMEQGGERAGEYTGLIAEHLELAGQREKAAIYLRRAGEQAAAKFSNAEAVRYLDRALALTPESDHAERYALLLVREKVYDVQGTREAQAQDLATLTELAETLADDQRQAEVAVRQANYAEATSDYPATGVAAQMAIRLGQAAQDITSEAAGYHQWGRALWRQGDFTAARTQFEKALVLAQAVQLRRLEADSLRNLGIVSAIQGDHTGARAYTEQSLRISREISDQRRLAMALNNLGNIAFEQGDYGRCRAYWDRSLLVKQEIGDRQGEGRTLNNLGNVSFVQGDYAGTRTYFEQSLRIFREIGDRQGEGEVLSDLGLLYHHLVDDEGAREYSQQGLLIAKETGDRSRQAYAFTNLGHAQVGLGLMDEAIMAYQQALTLRRELGQPNLAMEPLAALARLSLAQGDLTQALAQVEEILTHLKSNTLDGTEEPFRVYLTCYHVLRANRDARAQEILTTAYNLLQEYAGNIPDEEMRRSFLENVPAHRELVREWAKGK